MVINKIKEKRKTLTRTNCTIKVDNREPLIAVIDSDVYL